MWQLIMSFIGGPVIKGLLDAYNAHLKATTDDKQIAADLAGKEIAAQTVEIQEQQKLKTAEIGHAWEPEKLAFYIVLVFFAKCVIWDKVLGLGTTDPLAGDVSVWAGMVMGFYFGKKTVENALRILKRT